MSAVVAPAPRRGKAKRAAPGERSLVLVPPEGVPINLAIPSLGARVGAQVIDILATLIATVLLVVALIYTDAVGPEAIVAVGSLLFLLIGTPFYIVSELLMNGRTPGKRLVGVRVVSLDGGGLTTHQIVVRNLLKEVEIFLPLQTLPFLFVDPGPVEVVAAVWALVVLVVPLRNRARQRIGDIAAGTVVVVQPTARLLPDLAAGTAAAESPTPAPEAERFVFTSEQLDLYGAYELQVLEKVLRGCGRREAAGALDQVAASIAAKIGYGEAIEPGEREAFLFAFYRAQRAFLEGRKLFGDARDDKFHRDAGKADAGRTER